MLRSYTQQQRALYHKIRKGMAETRGVNQDGWGVTHTKTLHWADIDVSDCVLCAKGKNVAYRFGVRS